MIPPPDDDGRDRRNFLPEAIARLTATATAHGKPGNGSTPPATA
ncbi:hypothetical protein ACWEFL_31305 [Streptomyces sp. NPDC004838]